MQQNSRYDPDESAKRDPVAESQDEVRFRLQMEGFPKGACELLFTDLEPPSCYDALCNITPWSGFVGAILGPNGVGKTVTATALAADRYTQLKPSVRNSRYVVLHAMSLMDLDEQRTLIRKMRRADLLVIDEYDKANHSDYLHNTICFLIGDRSESKKDTLFITNMKEPEFMASLDGKVRSYVGSQTKGFIIEMTGGSLR